MKHFIVLYFCIALALTLSIHNRSYTQKAKLYFQGETAEHEASLGQLVRDDIKGKPDNKKPGNSGNNNGNVSNPDPGIKNNQVTAYSINCNSKGRCWQWCGQNDKLAAAKKDFHKEMDGRWCYTTAENYCKTRENCKDKITCLDSCEARWGQEQPK